MGSILGYFTMPHPPIIIPEVGKGQEEKIKSTSEAVHKVAQEIAQLKPDIIILITPHGPMFRDAVAISTEQNISGSLSEFRAPQVKMDLEIDTVLCDKIIKNSQEFDVPIISINKKTLETYGLEYKLDHGAIVPLYFVLEKYINFKVVHITYGLLSDIQLYKFGIAIKNAVEESDLNVVFIASGDLSHKLKEEGPYSYSPDGEKFDKEIIELLRQGNVLGVFNMDSTTVENAGECGLRSYYIMLGAMDGFKIQGELLSYEGTFGVGYGVMRFNIEKGGSDILTRLIAEKEKRHSSKIHSEDPYVRLARQSLTSYLINGKYISPPDYIPEEMKKIKRGVFVSLKKYGNLRGCIGTILPYTDSLAEEIIRNAVDAGLKDPRFSPVEEKELEDIDFSVDVLTEPSKVEKNELDPKKYGVIVRKERRTGLLLPNLEGVDTVEKQLSIALEKAGISPEESFAIEKFEVIRHK